jgi:hypothetical protein
MRRLILALTLTLTAASTAGAACFNVYLPDLAPPAGVPTGVIAAEFPVAPTTTALFYPFNVLLDTAGHLTVTQEVGVGDPSNARRTWSNVTRVSLVSWMSYFKPAVSYAGEDYAADAAGQWRRTEDNMVLLGYETLANSAPAGVEPTWAFRTDWRVTARRFNSAMSTPVNPGTGWNIGVYAPGGIQALGLQVKMQVCQP